ncbi:MAG: phospholipase, partial [Micromonosporaceae bacterium]|nr:phospholipase [Micromonosporaceae bacterium]
KLAVLKTWSQATAKSARTWNTARQDQQPWTPYSFDWSTDHCSASPDQPLGFDFRLACHRHDFGYRNAKDLKVFTASKARLDKVFYFDLSAICDRQSSIVQPACDALALTYYTAVDQFGALSVDQASLDAATTMKAEAEAEAEAASPGGA